MRLSTLPGLILLVLACACHVTEPAAGTPKPVPLEFGLLSYATPEEARERLPTLSWNVVERPRPASGRCSRFDQKHLTVSGFVAHGYKGELRLDFINGRPFKVLFFPEDPGYFDYLRSHELSFTSVDVAFPSRGTSLTISSPPGSRAFAAWADMKVDDQVAEWLLRCS